jgi:hypothetical protein
LAGAPHRDRREQRPPEEVVAFQLAIQIRDNLGDERVDAHEPGEDVAERILSLFVQRDERSRAGSSAAYTAARRMVGSDRLHASEALPMAEAVLDSAARTANAEAERA